MILPGVFEKFFDISADGLFIMDREYHFLEVNQSYCSLAGWSRDELLAKCFTDIGSETDFQKHIMNVETSGKNIFETSLIRKDGTEAYVEINTALFEFGNERLFLSHGRDISSRQKPEDVKKIQQYARYVIDSSFDMIIAVDEDRNIADFNNAAQKAFGYTKEEVIGKKISMLYSDPEQAKIPADILMEKGYFTSEVLNRKKNGKVFHSFVTATHIKDENGKILGTMGVSRDISDQIEREKELNKAKKQAETASKAKDDFFANMTHEIRTPLNAIIGHTELGLETNSPSEMKQYLVSINESADFLLLLLNSVLLYSKIEAKKLELEECEFNFRVAVESIAQIMSAQAQKKNIELLCHISPDIPKCLVGDSARLKQILVNLIGNAIKFTDKGEIIVEVRKDNNKKDSSKEKKNAITLFFSIKDTGIGIPHDKIDSIFESFKQVDSSITRKYSGTGIGLTIANKLINLMNGKICVESELGKGSTFLFTITFKTSSKQASIDGELDLTGKRAFMIDNNEMARFILREMLEKMGFEVDEAENSLSGFNALKASADAGNPYDIIIIDSRVPDGSGFKIAQKIKENPSLARSSVILLNANHRRGDTDKVRELGLNGYLLKPVRQIELKKIIAKSFGLKFFEPSEDIEKKEAGALYQPAGENESQEIENLNSQRLSRRDFWEKPYLDLEIMSSPDTRDESLLLKRRAFIRSMDNWQDMLEKLTNDNNFHEIEKIALEIKNEASDAGADLVQNEAFRIVLASSSKDADRCKILFNSLVKAFKMTEEIIIRKDNK